MFAHQQNRWHQRDFKNNLLKTAFIEWKYFNFSDKRLSGVIVLMQHDPLNISHHGGATAIARFYHDHQAFGGACRSDWHDAKFSSFSPKASIDQSVIKVFGKHLRLIGSMAETSWDLEFRPLSRSIKGFKALKLDLLNIEKAWWLIAQPKARVRGTVTIGEKSYDINCYGYADANWGQVLPLSTKINWAQFNNHELSLVVGETDNLEIAGEKIGRWGKTFLSYQGKQIVFEADEFELISSHQRKLPGTEYKIARETKIVASNRYYKLELVIKPIIIDPIRFQMPYGIPLASVIAEQVAQFQGRLSTKSGKTWRLAHKFSGRGYLECTLRGLELDKKTPKVGVSI